MKMINITVLEQKQREILGISGDLCIHDFCNIREIATFLHDTYESASKRIGWNTQERCQVAFEDLPEKNKQVMLIVAKEIYEKYISKKELKRKNA